MNRTSAIQENGEEPSITARLSERQESRPPCHFPADWNWGRSLERLATEYRYIWCFRSHPVRTAERRTVLITKSEAYNPNPSRSSCWLARRAKPVTNSSQNKPVRSRQIHRTNLTSTPTTIPAFFVSLIQPTSVSRYIWSVAAASPRKQLAVFANYSITSSLIAQSWRLDRAM